MKYFICFFMLYTGFIFANEVSVSAKCFSRSRDQIFKINIYKNNDVKIIYEDNWTGSNVIKEYKMNKVFLDAKEAFFIYAENRDLYQVFIVNYINNAGFLVLREEAALGFNRAVTCEWESVEKLIEIN